MSRVLDGLKATAQCSLPVRHQLDRQCWWTGGTAWAEQEVMHEPSQVPAGEQGENAAVLPARPR